MNIYTIQDLMTKDFDDEEIELVNKSLQHSLIIGMFKYMKYNLTQKEIIEVVKEDGWYNKWEWNENQRKQFVNKLTKIFYNLYRFGPIKCDNSAQEWVMKYGFKLKIPNINKHGKTKVYKY